jgi:REP element-mobilizing transposase RayT
MPRTERVAPKGHIYHVLTRGNNLQDIFEDEEDFRKYLHILLLYKEKYHFKLYHYVIMTNHVHLVIEPSERGGGLSEIMNVINLSYAQHYKHKYCHIGHLWSGQIQEHNNFKRRVSTCMWQLCGIKSSTCKGGGRSEGLYMEQLTGVCLWKEKCLGRLASYLFSVV